METASEVSQKLIEERLPHLFVDDSTNKYTIMPSTTGGVKQSNTRPAPFHGHTKEMPMAVRPYMEPRGPPNGAPRYWAPRGGAGGGPRGMAPSWHEQPMNPFIPPGYDMGGGLGPWRGPPPYGVPDDRFRYGVGGIYPPPMLPPHMMGLLDRDPAHAGELPYDVHGVADHEKARDMQREGDRAGGRDGDRRREKSRDRDSERSRGREKDRDRDRERERDHKEHSRDKDRKRRDRKDRDDDHHSHRDRHGRSKSDKPVDGEESAAPSSPKRQRSASPTSAK